MSYPPPGSTDPFTTVAFLAGSPNRIAVLDALAEFGPVPRFDLVERLGVSRVTVGRILNDFVARQWVAREGTTFRITPVGEVVCETFGALLTTVESMDRLSSVQPWLPADFDIDARRLATARITVPTWSDSVAPIRRAAELCYGLDSLRVCASGVAPDVIQGIRDAAVDEGTHVEVVMTSAGLDVIRDDPTMRGWFADLVDAGGRVHEHPGHSYLVATCDRTAIVGMNDDAGAPRGLVESTDVAVFDWVDSVIDRCRAEGQPVEHGVFAE
jgi:predicted transcriptional regulator